MESHGFARASVSLLVIGLLSISCASQSRVVSGGLSGDIQSVATVAGSSTLSLDIRPGPGVSDRRLLSYYVPSLKNGPGDSPVFVLDSGKPGATLLVVAGTHANELAGMVTATMLVERAVPTQGRVIVVPCLNSSGLSYSEPGNPQPSWISLNAASGTRYFRYGARLVYPGHQGQDDPEYYLHPASRAQMPGEEQRNINRAYPGYTDGPLAQRVAAAIMAIIREEGVGLAVDMHEARPSSKLKWMIVAHPKYVDLAVGAIFDLEDSGIDMKLDRSSEDGRGLSHREWGDNSGTAAFLVETVNPAQDKLSAAAVDQLAHREYPLWRRVAVQISALGALVKNYNAAAETGQVEFIGLPDYPSLERQGLEAFF